MMAEDNSRMCEECSKPIVGRTDKRFCDDQCRNNFNNRLNSDANNFVRNINYILRKNRRILAKLSPKGKSKARKKDLLDMGYNFNYHTNVYHTKSGKTYYFCYDYGYLTINKDYYALVIRQEYVE